MRETGGDLSPDNVCELGPVAIGADHDLQRPVAVDAAKVKVAFRGDICDVCSYAPLLAQFVDLRRCFWVVHGSQDHVDTVEIRGLELAVDIIDLALVDAVGDLVVEAFARGDDGYFGVGVEDVHDAPGSNLDFVSMVNT